MESSTQFVLAVTCVISALSAVFAAGICWWIWRSVRKSIADGDAGVKKHSESSLLPLRQAVSRIERSSLTRSTQMFELKTSITRIEATIIAEQQHVLRPRDLGNMHEKINAVAKDVEGMKGAQSAQYRALHEQLALLQRTLTNGNRDKR